MAERLAAGFGRAVDASLREVAPDDLGRQLGKYLADAFAIESQALQLLEQGRRSRASQTSRRSSPTTSKRRAPSRRPFERVSRRGASGRPASRECCCASAE